MLWPVGGKFAAFSVIFGAEKLAGGGVLCLGTCELNLRNLLTKLPFVTGFQQATLLNGLK